MFKSKSFFLSVLLVSHIYCFSQVESKKEVYHFSGNISGTNNGISLIPSFSIGKPALMSLLSIGSERFSIDPDIRFTLEGKPWTFVFNTRYKLLVKPKLNITTGVNYGLNYRMNTFIENGMSNEYTVARRYIGTDISTNYFIKKNNSIGMYYLYAQGIDFGTIQHTHFITLSTNFSKIPINENYYFSFRPQIYKLFQEDKNGLFTNATMTISKNKFPFSLSYMFNKKIESNLTVKDYTWSLNLIYNFNQNFTIQTK